MAKEITYHYFSSLYFYETTQVDWMHEKFGVRYTNEVGVDILKNGDGKWSYKLDDKEYTGLFYIHPESLHIFEYKVNDLVVCNRIDNARRICSNETYDELKRQSDENSRTGLFSHYSQYMSLDSTRYFTPRIILRDNIVFMTPITAQIYKHKPETMNTLEKQKPMIEVIL